MRVTQNMMYNSTLQNIFKNQRRLLDLDQQVSTEKRINNPSDDPLGATKVLGYRETLAKLDQYPRNMDKAQSWLSSTDSVLQELMDNLQGAKTLALQQATGSMSAESRQAAVEEVEGLIQGLIQVGNTMVGDQYIFAGSLSHVKPFNDDGTYNGNNRDLSAEIGPNNYQVYNVPGSSFLVTDLNPNLASGSSTTGLLDIPSAGYATGPAAQLALDVMAVPVNNTTYDLKLDLGADGGSKVTFTTGAAATQDELGQGLADSINADKSLNRYVGAVYDTVAKTITLTAKSTDTTANDYRVGSTITPYTNASQNLQFTGTVSKLDSGFLFAAGVNDALQFSINGIDQDIDIFRDSDAVAGQVYTGDEAAGFLEQALERRSLAMGKDLSWTVGYDSSIDRFTIGNDEANADSNTVTIGPDNNVITVEEIGTMTTIDVTIPQGDYSAESLAQQLGQSMTDASVSGCTYTVGWDADQKKFTIGSTAAGVADFDIPWTTAGRQDLARTLGFDTADTATATSFTGVNSLEEGASVDFKWDDPLTTIGQTFGFSNAAPATPMSPVIAGQSDTSDYAVNFNVLAGINDTFDISVDGSAPMTVTVNPGTYTSETLAQELQNGINAQITLAGGPPPEFVSVDYGETNAGLFSIVSGSTGPNSSISLTPGATDFLRMTGMDEAPITVDGTDSVLLSDLHRGEGARLDGGLVMTDRAGNNVSVYTGEARTVNDIIDSINNRTITIGPSNSSLVIDTDGFAVPGGEVTVTIPPADYGTYTPAALAALLPTEAGWPAGYTMQYDTATTPGGFEIDSGGTVFGIDWDSQPAMALTLGFTGQQDGGTVYGGSSVFTYGLKAAINEQGNGIQIIDTNPASAQVQPLRIYDTDTARDLGIFSGDTVMTVTPSNNTIYFRDVNGAAGPPPVAPGTMYRATIAPGSYNGNQMVKAIQDALTYAVDDQGNKSRLTFDASYDPVSRQMSIVDSSDTVLFNWTGGGLNGGGSSAASVLGFTRNHTSDVGTGFHGDQVAGTEGYGNNIKGSDLDPLVMGYTSISQLYGGAGVSLGKITITNGKQQAEVDLSTARTVQDVIELINGSGAGVAARVNGSGASLEIYSLSPGTSPVVMDADSKKTGTLLGLQAGNDILGTLKDFKQALLDNDQDALQNVMSNLQGAIDRVNKVLGDTGSRTVNVDDMQKFVENHTLTTKQLLSNTEDVDITEAIMKYMNQQQAFETALAAAAKVTEVSLLDYLK